MYKDLILKALNKATGEADINISVPEVVEHGDYSSNIALKLKAQDSKLKDKTARQVAEELVMKLQEDKDIIGITDSISVAGPGFINFKLNNVSLMKNIDDILETGEKYGSSEMGKGKKVLVEYSAPNIAKHFGVGHLRSTIIGQSLYNLYKFLGFETIGENHLGDWGTQFGTLVYQITSKGLDPKTLDVTRLQEMYVEFNSEAEKNPNIWNEAKLWFKKLEEGDSEAREVWQIIRETSLSEFEKIYKLLDVKIDNAHGESFYEDKMGSVISEVREKKLSKKSEGAEIVEFEGSLKANPAMLLKSDGTTTYFTRDLAALKFRLSEWSPNIFIYEVGSDQVLHFRQVFETAKLLGWTEGVKLVHVPHGLFRFKDGKMSTRRGKTVNLSEVIHEAIVRASKFNKDKTVSEAVGVGAIKYFDLMHSPTSEIIFDWDKIFVLEGNSGPYLQYSVARCNSILAKTSKPLKRLTNTSANQLNSEESLTLRHLVHFPEVIESAALTHSPNLLCNYLFELAQTYNTFYNKHKIIDSGEDEGKRLLITSAVGQTLRNGLTLLGIKSPDRM